DVAEHEPPVRLLDGQPLGGALLELLVVGVARGHGLVEDRRVRRTAPDAVVVDELLQPALGDERPGEVVVPRALPEVVEPGDGAGHDVPFGARARRERARSATWVGLIPRWSITTRPGADAPHP